MRIFELLLLQKIRPKRSTFFFFAIKKIEICTPDHFFFRFRASRMDLLECCSNGNEVADDKHDCEATLNMFDVEPLAVDHITSTPLFDAIVRNDWDAVDFFLESGTFSFSPFHHSDDRDAHAATEDQVETWIVCQNDDGRLLWRQLPIHAAICYGAPFNTVKELVKTYPGGLCCADNDGNLPLHLAVKFNRDDSILSLLFTAFPEGFHAENGRGQTPLQCAEYIEDPVGRDRFELLKTFGDNQIYFAKKDCCKIQEELDDVTKRKEEATLQLSKAQRELWYLKRFQIPKITTRKERLLSWRKGSKKDVQNE